MSAPNRRTCRVNCHQLTIQRIFTSTSLNIKADIVGAKTYTMFYHATDLSPPNVWSNFCNKGVTKLMALTLI